MSQSTTDETYNIHRFKSADGKTYVWEDQQESAIGLKEDEILQLRSDILGMSDTLIQNGVSGNGVPMGVKIPLTQERLNDFLQFILDIIKIKEKLAVITSTHATQRLEEDSLNGPGHPDSRGWFSEDDIQHCVCTINQVEGARLTVDRMTLKDTEIKFHSPIALEVVGKKSNGEQGTLALAFIDATKVRIITLLT